MYQFNLEDHISLEEYEKLCKEESKDELDNAFIRLISAYQDYNSDMIEKESLNLSSLVKQYRNEEKEIKVYITSILDEYGRYTYWHREVVIVIQWDSNRTVLNISRTILDEIIHDSTKLIVYCVSNDIFITGGDILYIYVLGYDNYVEKIIEIHNSCQNKVCITLYYMIK